MLFIKECLHCSCFSSTLFCLECQEKIELLYPKICDPNTKKRTTLFSCFSPIYTLYKTMENNRLHYYLPGIVAFCNWQLLHLQWPIERVILDPKLHFFSKKRLVVNAIAKRLARENGWQYGFFFPKEKQIRSTLLLVETSCFLDSFGGYLLSLFSIG